MYVAAMLVIHLREGAQLEASLKIKMDGLPNVMSVLLRALIDPYLRFITRTEAVGC